MKRKIILIIYVFTLIYISCAKESTLEPVYRDGMPVQDSIVFELYSENEGIYPDESVLDNPNNPFVGKPISEKFKWDIEANGDAVTRFYMWATFLTYESWGEPQLFTAMALEELAAEYSSTNLRNHAIRAYQNVLDYFPYDETYDEVGDFYWSNGVKAYESIETLGGTPKGYVLGEDANGNTILVAKD